MAEVTKADRLDAIMKILRDPEVNSQFYIKDELEKKYGILVTQGTISKDLKAIGARIDKKSGRIIFESELFKTEAAGNLTKLLQSSNLKVLGEQKLTSLMVKVDEKYSQIASYQIVEYFKMIEIEVYVFNGISGVMQILVPEGHAKRVEEYLKKIPKKE
jgi:arginine repressor